MSVNPVSKAFCKSSGIAVITKSLEFVKQSYKWMDQMKLLNSCFYNSIEDSTSLINPQLTCARWLQCKWWIMFSYCRWIATLSKLRSNELFINNRYPVFSFIEQGKDSKEKWKEATKDKQGTQRIVKLFILDSLMVSVYMTKKSRITGSNPKW